MIDHIYIDNYRCFTNFEFKPAQFELFLGPNGSGKTSILDVLETLRNFITTGMDTIVAFPPETRTAWDPRQKQTFEIGLKGNGGHYKYTLIIEHQSDGKKNRVEHETLTFDRETLYEFVDNEAHLYRDGGSEGPKFPFDWSRSAIPTIPERDINTRLSWFRAHMEKVYVFSPDPLRMTSRSEGELEMPDRHLHEFASWLRHLSQERMGVLVELNQFLGEVVDGFKGLRLVKAGETMRELKIDFGYQGESISATEATYTLPFEALSAGQRNLMALFTIVHAVVQKDTTVCIDEPDNYVALREIQPLLTLLKDKADDESSQCFLVSHNPEVLNYLAAHHGTWFYRRDGGPTRVRRFEYEGDDPMAPAEIIAQGLE